MAYSTNPEIVYDRMPLLRELAAARATRWRLDTPDRDATRRFVYRVREALYCAWIHKDIFPELALAYENFSIHLIEPGVVEAKLKIQDGLDGVRVEAPGAETPVHGTAVWGKEVSTVSKTTAQELIDAWQAHLPSNDPLKFPQTKLPPEELRALHVWASSEDRHPRLMILVGAESITLSLRTPDMAAFAWQPPPEPPKPEKPYDI